MALNHSSCTLSIRIKTTMDIVSFAFNGPVEYDQTRPLYIDARDPSRSLNAQQFKHLVQTLVAGLKRHVQPGDAVLVHLGNSFIHSALFFSIVGAGNVYIGAGPDSPAHELDNVVQAGEPKLILTSSATLQRVLEVATGRSIPANQICVISEETILSFLQSPDTLTIPTTTTETPTELIPLTTLLTHGTSPWTTLTAEEADATPASMFCTSGTSGLPKAAILSHRNMITHHSSSHYAPSYAATRRLIAIPVHHLYGAVWTHIFPIRYGSPVYLLPRFEIHAFLQATHRYQITNTYLVPAMVHILNQAPAHLDLPHHLASVRYMLVSAAPIDVPALETLQASLPHPEALVTQNWGMTETGLVFLSPYTDKTHDKASIGRVRGEGVEVQLVESSSGSIIAEDDRAGEMWIRGPGIFMEYKRMPSDKEPGGWFRTGDMVFRRRGLYYLVGRVKEIIKVRGYSVAPAEIEDVLVQHPGIKDAAVLGVHARDGSGTEVPRAFVVKTTTVTEDEVYGFVAARLARYKALDGGVVFVSAIPRTATGKIQRARLGLMNAQREKIAKILGVGKVGVSVAA
ncbi:acetyl-CoA synthetase-like protein [Aspergillus homomorphus CBS 101889]|uniref:Acetyl-CoA synthetase-like protein n=1 Tax=Aspergillus homomorphus (strain CBS 101889) TaxID=1450537 RepID=A0A395HT58_ASPHC|nr:acetyl-CoA synthetase-like protein [Aspergillus homomorphus CBS 101889]RAL10593.1 acetyl-CoA synthetase-like protein [Aspergillus homomorphus CBS 101889]